MCNHALMHENPVLPYLLWIFHTVTAIYTEIWRWIRIWIQILRLNIYFYGFFIFWFFRVHARSWFEFFLLPRTILNHALSVGKILRFKPFRWSILMVNTSQRYPSIFWFFDFSRPSACNFRVWLWDFSAVSRDLELKIRLNGGTSIGFRGLEGQSQAKQKRDQTPKK